LEHLTESRRLDDIKIKDGFLDAIKRIEETNREIAALEEKRGRLNRKNFHYEDLMSILGIYI
jgi:hypothetical protein